ncbi:MAG TPA: hypothetical protein DEA40_15405, partial [Parvularcula sp.]|nr:hypothetical protein [Parvularcula sp.]
MPRKSRQPTIMERLDRWRREATARAGGIATALLGLWLALAFASFSISDPSFNNATARDAANWMGGLGAGASDLLLQLFGGAALLAIPPLMIWGAVAAIRGAGAVPRDRTPLDVAVRFAMGPIAFALVAGALALAPVPASWPFAAGLGGLVGDAAGLGLQGILAAIGAPSPGVFAALILGLPGAVLYATVCGLTFARIEAAAFETEALALKAGNALAARFDAISRQDARRDEGDLVIDRENDPDTDEETRGDEEPPLAAPKRRNIIREKESPKKPGKREAREVQPELPVFKPGSYELPALNLLGKPAPQKTRVISDEALEQNARMLENV